MHVTCLCATWCLTCEAYKTTFAEVRALFPNASFKWVDIEDEAELVGAVDIQNFPTLLILEGAQVRFFGPLKPQPRVLEAIILAAARNAVGQRDLDRDVEDLADRLAALVPGDSTAPSPVSST